ncbi:uncharacterized protein LOC114450136 [Parambassis ranga]|uniref:Uncharacterized protein LOC114450136 n=1 Tax=Parambassis ranga TaxID=210632 RepID=A0A6P7K5B8_9TELE|nr:uncharacterized protein LOC114450136 [Parambassis ranga]
MAEEILNDSFPELKELEIKIGRKTPESLLIWLRDAVDCEEGWRPDVVVGEDTISDKINNLKQEMRWLRSADVRILRQLVAVHEGIEAMRWLMEERGTMTSRGSSLTGSLSSLATVEEHGPSMSPCRETPSPTGLQDLIETTIGESDDQRPHTDDSNHKGYFDVLSSESSEARPPSPCRSKFTVSRSTQESHDEASFSPASSANGAKSQPQDFETSPFKDIKSGAHTIRRALLRSGRRNRELKIDTGSFDLTQWAGEAHTGHNTEKSFTASHTNTMEEEERVSSRERDLLGYDTQWCWVESQDDVTFL